MLSASPPEFEDWTGAKFNSDGSNLAGSLWLAMLLQWLPGTWRGFSWRLLLRMRCGLP